MALAIQHIAKILRTREEVLENFGILMNKRMGLKNVFDEIMGENESRVRRTLAELHLSKDSSAEDIFHALIVRLRETDENLVRFLNQPVCTTPAGCGTVVDLAKHIHGKTRGFFLKHEIAETLLRKTPPQNLLKELGYGSVDELLQKHTVSEAFPAIRFAEDSRWLNDVFFRPYALLTPADFEEREVSVIVLPEQWRDIGKKFVGKKLHHISHLKELGIIFVMPVSEENHGGAPSGTTLEIVTILLHYLNEVPFYSRIFQRFAKDPERFAHHITSALPGDVLDHIPDGKDAERRFLIVQRYLAKDDPSDPRLFMPHLNPEAVHWSHVTASLSDFGRSHKELGLGFWDGLDYIGDHFPLSAARDENFMGGVSEEILVPFNFIDTLISHNRYSSVFTKYLYHQQEALWNRLFSGWLGKARMEGMVEDNLEKWYIEI